MSHYRNTVLKVKLLEKLYPKYNFIGVCIQPFNEVVFEVHRMMNINPETQMAFTNFDKDSKKWVISLLNRAIIVDTDGKIKEGFGNFSASDFEDILKIISFLSCNLPKTFSIHYLLRGVSTIP
jgi:hypothetical protein